MTTLWTILSILGALLTLCGWYVFRLIRNRPDIKEKLELMKIPTDFFDPDPNEGSYRDDQKISDISKLEVERANVPESIVYEPNFWFEEQKQKALKQLAPYYLKNVHFIDTPSFQEGIIHHTMTAYILDAVFNLERLMQTVFKRKKKVVFYLSQDSDGIFHKRLKGHNDQSQKVILIQAWTSED